MVGDLLAMHAMVQINRVKDYWDSFLCIMRDSNSEGQVMSSRLEWAGFSIVYS